MKKVVDELQDGLLKLGNPSYNNIDKLMKSLMKKYDLTAKELHYGFRDLNDDKTPDEWIKGKRKMKTFREFLEEAQSYRTHPHFSSKDELLKHHGGKLPSGTFIKNRGSTETPQYGIASIKSREDTSKRRDERIQMTTGQLTPKQNRQVQIKRSRAKRKGKEVHHATEIETSAKEMQHTTPGDRLRHKSKQAKQNKYSGDDPKNLVLANKGSVKDFKPEQPGFHHGKYHAFERKHRSKLRDIGNAIEPIRAFTTLVNKERRKIKKSKELKSRMATAAERRGIED
jgi:hypothetical protein